MQRREFIRIVGGTALTSLFAPTYDSWIADNSANKSANGILVEACAFQNPGGWKIDTQHYQQMGGCYLLAHGMGRPVEDATTTVKFPGAGKWNCYVRTRDWCPGDWESPGRFKLLVNGSELPTEFGASGPAGEKWHWQHGGEVDIQSPGQVDLQLHDLTGFDGRCDAIFFSREPIELPNSELLELAGWKDKHSLRTGKGIEELSFDLVIVGGGIAGCSAALSARSQGLSVALIQDRPLFGGNASQEIRVHTIGIHGKGKQLLSGIDTPHYPNGHADAKLAQTKREQTMADSGVDLFAHHICIGLEKEGQRILSIEAREVTSGTIKRFRAPVFIDATGDGWLGYWAGADYREGRESHTEFGEQWDKHGDLWSPEQPDRRVMGASVLWNSEKSDQAVNFPPVPWAEPVAKQHQATQGEWYWEYSSNELDQIDDAEQIRDHMLRAIYGSFANAKKNPKNATVALKWVAHVAGKRESRRLMGDYVYTMQDMTERRTFEDAVVEEVREVDAHYQIADTGSPSDFLSKALFRTTGGKYYVPFRSLYSRNIENLMMAGRCFSCSHIGLCGPRVMLTCGQMGIAVGYAASLCKKHSELPRQVGKQHIGELRSLIGYN